MTRPADGVATAEVVKRLDAETRDRYGPNSGKPLYARVAFLGGQMKWATRTMTDAAMGQTPPSRGGPDNAAEMIALARKQFIASIGWTDCDIAAVDELVSFAAAEALAMRAIFDSYNECFSEGAQAEFTRHNLAFNDLWQRAKITIAASLAGQTAQEQS